MGYIPSFIRYNKKLTPTSKLLYAELTAMIGVDGKCTINLKHLTHTFNCSNNEIKNMLNLLFNIGVIKKEGKKIVLLNKLVPPKKEYLEGVDSNFIDEVIKHWNLLFKVDIPSGIRRTPILIKVLTERQLNFTNEEIMTALTNRHSFVGNSEWHQLDKNKRHRLNIMIVLKDDEKLQEFLNMDISLNCLGSDLKAVKREVASKSILE